MCRTCRTRMLGRQRLVRNKSCVSGSWNLENDTTHGQMGSTYTAADRRPTNRVSAWQAKSESRPTRATSSWHPGEDVARVGRVDEDVTGTLRVNWSRGI